jgi:hypothetical protein
VNVPPGRKAAAAVAADIPLHFLPLRFQPGVRQAAPYTRRLHTTKKGSVRSKMVAVLARSAKSETITVVVVSVLERTRTDLRA